MGKPLQISCLRYVAGDGRRCAHYRDGACARPDEFMCVEWLRSNGYLRDPLPGAREHLRQVRATSPPPAPPKPSKQIGLFPRLRPQRNP
jgi:hypothetical protein